MMMMIPKTLLWCSRLSNRGFGAMDDCYSVSDNAFFTFAISTHATIEFIEQTIKEMLGFLTRTFMKRTEPGQRQSITHEDYVVHCYVRSDGLGGTVVTDSEYPARVAFVLLTQLLDDFTAAVGDRWKTCTAPESIAFPALDEYLQKFQDPSAADKITKIQNDLDETTQILHKTIDSVLERGVKLDNLVERSNDLSAQSKMFYKQAKKTNSCCVIS